MSSKVATWSLFFLIAIVRLDDLLFNKHVPGLFSSQLFRSLDGVVDAFGVFLVINDGDHMVFLAFVGAFFLNGLEDDTMFLFL